MSTLCPLAHGHPFLCFELSSWSDPCVCEGGDKNPKVTNHLSTTPNMPSPYPKSTPTKPAHSGGDSKPLLLAKFDPSSPSESRCPPRTPTSFGSRTTRNGAEEITARKRVGQSMTPIKPLARFDSLCDDSKAILGDMAGMFSPVKIEPGTPEVSPFKVRVDMVSAAGPVREKRNGKDRRDDQGNQGQRRRKKVVNRRQIKRRADPPADLAPIPEEDSQKF